MINEYYELKDQLNELQPDLIEGYSNLN